MTSVSWPVRDGADVWTPRAVAGLIGQHPRLTKNFDHSRPSVRTVVTDAVIEDGNVVITLELPQDCPVDVIDLFVPAGEPAGYGVTVRDSGAQPNPGGRHLRTLLDVALREISDRGQR